jgi:hypothetical protein
MGHSAPNFNDDSRDGETATRLRRGANTTALLAASLLGLLVAAAPAHAAKYRYTVRYFEKDVGRLTVSEGTPSGGLTPVSVKGRLVVPGSNLDMVVSSKSLRTEAWLSAKLDLRFSIFGAPRVVHGTIDGNHFKGTFKDGDGPQQALDERAETGIGDVMTIGYLLGHQREDTKTVTTAVFGGFFVYRVDAESAGVETIALPVGPRAARRWEVVAQRPGKERRVTMWTDVKRQIPLMAKIDLDFLGPVTVVLSAER